MTLTVALTTGQHYRAACDDDDDDDDDTLGGLEQITSGNLR